MENIIEIATGKEITDKIQTDEYGSILKSFGITYTVENFGLESGNCSLFNRWVIYLSFYSKNAEEIIRKITPFLYAYNIPFKVTKNKYLIDKINDLWYGTNEAGKILTIYPDIKRNNELIIRQIDSMTMLYSGPVVQDTVRLGKIMYVSYCEALNITNENGNLAIRYYVPKTVRKYFTIPKKYKVSRRKAIIGRYYVPIKLLKFNPKGDLQVGVNLKNFQLTKCLIKQARSLSSEDSYGRSAFHKLLWQSKVIQDIDDDIPTAAFIDFCRNGQDHYLILEYLEGQTLRQIIHSIHNNRPWQDLSSPEKAQLIGYVIQVIEIIIHLHKIGYLHRDIQVDNFIIDNGVVRIIDFELAYSLKDQMPTPAYGMGTLGFVSPEQMAGRPPSVTEDIYSIGALIGFVILNPLTLAEFSDDLTEKLTATDLEDSIIHLIGNCMDENPHKRPYCDIILKTLSRYLKTLSTSRENK